MNSAFVGYEELGSLLINYSYSLITMSSSIKNNKHPMLTKFESLVSSGAQKVTKEIEVGKLEGVKIIKQNGRFSSQVFF